MATNQENIQKILDLEEEILGSNVSSQEFYKTRIVLLESEKEKFQEPARILDRALVDQVKEINNLRKDISDLYADNINVSGDNGISDKFWRVVGFGFETATPTTIMFNLKCEKLKKYYDIIPNTYIGSPTVTPLSGFTTESVMIYDNSTDSTPGFTTYFLDKVERKGEEQLFAGDLDNSLAGFFQPDDKDALKLYTEPYTIDVLDSVVARTYGVAESGSEYITLLVPTSNTTSPVNNIEQGNIVTSEPEGAFAGGFANVVSVGTTDFDLSPYADITGVGNITTEVFQIRVDQNISIGFGTDDVPYEVGDDVDYPIFEFSVNPNQVSNFSEEAFQIDFEASPFVPQRIKVIKKESELDGSGVKIARAESGFDTKEAEWNKFLEGFPDPNNLDVTVQEPGVSDGKVYYTLGFTIGSTHKKPIKDPLTGGGDASVNDPREVVGPSVTVYRDLNGDLSNQTTIDEKETQRDALKAQWDRNNGKSASRIQLSNAFKDQMNEINTEIWGLRAQLGKADEIITSKKEFKRLLLSSDLLYLLENPDDITDSE